jgi:hypothetical protein
LIPLDRDGSGNGTAEKQNNKNHIFILYQNLYSTQYKKIYPKVLYIDKKTTQQNTR